MKNWVAIPRVDTEGRPLDPEIMLADTAEEIDYVAWRLYDLGIDKVRVMSGEPPNAVSTRYFVYSKVLPPVRQDGARPAAASNELDEVRRHLAESHRRGTTLEMERDRAVRERDEARRERDVLLLDPANKLEGYRELAGKVVQALDARDAALRERDEARRERDQVAVRERDEARRVAARLGRCLAGMYAEGLRSWSHAPSDSDLQTVTTWAEEVEP